MAEFINASDSLNEGRKKLNAIAKEMNDKDVASMPEVVNARNGEPSLKERLDKEHQEVTSQLQQKAEQSFVDSQFATIVSGAPKGTYTDLTSLQSAYPSGAEGIFLVLSDGHWYYWNSTTDAWTDGGVYQSPGGDWLEAMTEENESWVI